MHNTLFEKVRTKFGFKKTLTKFQSNADNRCKVVKQLYKYKTNINSVFTNFFLWFNKLLRSSYFFLQVYDTAHKLVSLEEEQGSWRPGPLP